jgi:hypothetical protein
LVDIAWLKEIEMRRSESDAWDLQGDLRDVQIYLDRSFRDIGRIPFAVNRHYASREDEIACEMIALFSERGDWQRVQARAEAALRHLGYKIERRGAADVYDVKPYMVDVSAHEIVRALARFNGLG